VDGPGDAAVRFAGRDQRIGEEQRRVEKLDRFLFCEAFSPTSFEQAVGGSGGQRLGERIANLDAETANLVVCLRRSRIQNDNRLNDSASRELADRLTRTFVGAFSKGDSSN
jgi:hypothetical protein